MLNRELLIARLAKGNDDDHEKLFALRRELRGLTLPVLAKRYQDETGDDPYNPSKPREEHSE